MSRQLPYYRTEAELLVLREMMDGDIEPDNDPGIDVIEDSQEYNAFMADMCRASMLGEQEWTYGKEALFYLFK